MNARSARGFSLVELIVAIAIITLLAGLLLTGLNALARRAEVTSTENTLRLLDLAVDEWQHAADRRLVRGTHDLADLRNTTEFVFVVTEVLRTVRRAPDAKSILAKIPADRVYTYDAGTTPSWIRTFSEEQALPSFAGEITILDAWDVPIYATHPGEVVPEPMDADGTERTINELNYGIARERRICFISAGPDQLFGILSEFPGLGADELYAAIAAAQEDNIYSYRPILEGTYGDLGSP